MDNTTIVQRFTALESERKGSVEQLWDLIERFILPFRGDFYTTLDEEANVDWHRRDVYDSTAVFAVQSLSATLQGNLTSPATRWFGLKFRQAELNERDEVKEWTEECTKRLFEAFQDSNFNIEMAESYTDLCGFGTTVLTEEVMDDLEWDGLNFQAIPIREIFFEEDHKKQIRKLYRRLQLTPVQIISQFGEENVPSDIKEKAEKPEGATHRETVIFAVYDRPENKDADVFKVLAPKARPFGFKYILKRTAETLGEEGGYYEMPAFVGRWRKVAGSRWGHSPSAVALGDILTLNQLVEATLEAAAKAVDPATLAEQAAIIGDLDLDRGALTVVNDINGIRTHESGTRFDVSNLTKENLQESIRKAFYQDQLELKESPAMTATEVNVRYEMIQRLMGPTLGRIVNDILDPLIQRTFRIMYRAGQLPELPPDIEVGELDIEYTGPLPRAQKMETAQAIQQWMMGIAEKAELFPAAMDLVDVDEAERQIAMLLGVPGKAMRSEEDIAQLREQRAAQEQQAAEAQSMMAGGEAAKSMGEGMQAVNEAGGMEEIMNQLGGEGGGPEGRGAA